jgi:hypothetical protein
MVDVRYVHCTYSMMYLDKKVKFLRNNFRRAGEGAGGEGGGWHPVKRV